MANLEIDYDIEALEKAMNESDAIFRAVESVTASKVARANSIASGYRSRGYYRNGELVDGHKEAEYDGNTERNGKGWIVGIVFTKNNAAYNENLEHNTLLSC